MNYFYKPTSLLDFLYDIAIPIGSYKIGINLILFGIEKFTKMHPKYATYTVRMNN